MVADHTQCPDPELDPAFEILRPAHLALPLVFNSPHSGAVYPKRFLASSRLDLMTLRRSEDSLVDELFLPVLEAGAPLMRALFPRCYLDVNREPYELDPRMFNGSLPPQANTRSVRVAGGLGTIARLVGEGQEIYAERLAVSEALRRIETMYRPYHRSLSRLLADAQHKFGTVLLIDCHSMPSVVRQGDTQAVADFVIGDRYGTSCAPEYSAVICDGLARQGYSVCRNKPYAGGYNTECYGNPASNCHAIQIEVNRALYMNERTLQRDAGFAATRDALRRVMAEVASLALRSCLPRALAAE